MALPVNLENLDYSDGGWLFAPYAIQTLDLSSLDYSDGGWLYFSQPQTPPVGAAVITISSAETQIHPVNRRFPNKTKEMIGETQIKQVSPTFGHQYLEYLP